MPFSLIDGLLAPAPKAERVAWLGEWNYAHRGLHGPGVPENSLAAAAGAISAGMGIECDVQRSSDALPMVFHDWELDRLTGHSGMVADFSSAELSELSLGGTGEHIPSLRDLLGMVRGRVPLLIEVKSHASRRPGPLCLAVRRALEGYGGQVAVMSFDPRVGAWFARHAPLLPRGLIVSEENARTLTGRVRRHVWLWAARPDFLAYDVRDFPSSFAAAQRKRGLPVLTWTVKSAELRQRAAQYADAPIAEGAGVAQG